MTDKAIIGLFFARDEAAIRESDEKYGKYCRTVADNILQSPPDAEECVNDTWLAAWQNIPPKRPTVLKMFFAAITRNLALDRWRGIHAEKRGGGEMQTAMDELAEVVGGSRAEDAVMLSELTGAINRYLGQLPARDRDVFLRRYFFCEDTRTIAARYTLREDNVLTILSRT